MCGVSLESGKESVKQEKKWECLFCRFVDKNCLLCKDRLKEINSLKRCITDLEKNLQFINAELAKGTLRCTELEDQVKIERQLRKKIERDLEEMQSNSSSSGSEVIVGATASTTRVPVIKTLICLARYPRNRSGKGQIGRQMSNGVKTETERNLQTEGKFPHLSKKDIISKIKK